MATVGGAVGKARRRSLAYLRCLPFPWLFGGEHARRKPPFCWCEGLGEAELRKGGLRAWSDELHFVSVCRGRPLYGRVEVLGMQLTRMCSSLNGGIVARYWAWTVCTCSIRVFGNADCEVEKCAFPCYGGPCVTPPNLLLQIQVISTPTKLQGRQWRFLQRHHKRNVSMYVESTCSYWAVAN